MSVRRSPEPVHVSGEQRLKMAQERAQENQSSLQKDLDAKRAGSSIHIKQEPVSDRDEPMDTSAPPSSSSIPNGSVNGYPSGTSLGFDHTNGNGGSPANTSSLELQDFVIKTFRKHFVLTLNEFKRLFNLHLASMPVGRSVFHSISDHMLQDAILLSQCKQIMVPVSIQGRISSSSAVKTFYLRGFGCKTQTHSHWMLLFSFRLSIFVICVV